MREAFSTGYYTCILICMLYTRSTRIIREISFSIYFVRTPTSFYVRYTRKVVWKGTRRVKIVSSFSRTRTNNVLVKNTRYTGFTSRWKFTVYRKPSFETSTHSSILIKKMVFDSNRAKCIEYDNEYQDYNEYVKSREIKYVKYA